MKLHSVLNAAHSIASEKVESGGLAIDATVGNGHDTLFLVQEVGDGGRVIGFDTQPKALEATHERVHRQAPSAADSLQLIHAGHESMAEYITDSESGTVDVVMFNLGYLPGSDHSVTTQPETTCQALETSASMLRPGGVITVVAYPGHEGGEREATAVASWMSALPQETFRALSYRFVNQVNAPPRLFAVEKREDGSV